MSKSRFIAKKFSKGQWRVYDTEKAAWPILVPGVGPVESGFESEEEAQQEADRIASLL